MTMHLIGARSIFAACTGGRPEAPDLLTDDGNAVTCKSCLFLVIEQSTAEAEEASARAGRAAARLRDVVQP